MSDDEYVPMVEDAWVDSENERVSQADDDDLQMLRNDSDNEATAALCNAPPQVAVALVPSVPPPAIASKTVRATPQASNISQPKKTAASPPSTSVLHPTSAPRAASPPAASARATLRTKELARLREHVQSGLTEYLWAPYSRGMGTSEERDEAGDGRQEIEDPEGVLLAQWATVPPASLAAVAAVANPTPGESPALPQFRLLADVARDTEQQRHRARILSALSNRLSWELGYVEAQPPVSLSSLVDGSGAAQSSPKEPAASVTRPPPPQHRQTNPLDDINGGKPSGDVGGSQTATDVEQSENVVHRVEGKDRLVASFDEWLRVVEATGNTPGGLDECVHLACAEAEVRDGWEAVERVESALLFERLFRTSIVVFQELRDSWDRAVLPPDIPEHVSVTSTEALRAEVEEASRAVDAATLELASLEAKVKQRSDEFQSRLERERATEMLLSAEETASVLEQIARLESLLWGDGSDAQDRQLARAVAERRAALYQRRLLQNADAIDALRQQIDRWEDVRESTGLANLASTSSSPGLRRGDNSRSADLAPTPGAPTSPVPYKLHSASVTPLRVFLPSTLVALSSPRSPPPSQPRATRTAPGSSASPRGAQRLF